MKNGLPKGWEKISLNNLCNLVYGKGLSTKELTASGFPVFGANGIIGFYKTYLYEKAKVIISCRGANSGVIHLTLPQSYITSNSIVLDMIISDMSNDYLKYAMESVDRTAIVTGTAQPQITIENLKDLEIPLPPLEEQNRIVAKLNAVFSRVNNCKERLENVSSIENRMFLKYIFKNGELYKGIPLANFCEEGIKRIGDEWKKRKLIGVSKDEGIVDLRVGGKKTFENYKVVKPGDFIYNPMRVDIGSIAIYDSKEDAITSPDYVVFRTNNLISSRLLLKFLKSSYGLAEINNNTQGSVRSRLYFRNLTNISFPYSNQTKQLEAEGVFRFFASYNQRSQKVLAYIDKMSESILSKAFRGELVPQNENDEPASILLNKIKRAKSIQKIVNRAPKKIAKKKNISTTTLPKKFRDMNLIEVIKKSFGENDFSYQELDKILDHRSKPEYIETKKQFFSLLRNEKFNKKTTKLTSKLDDSGKLKFKLVQA